MAIDAADTVRLTGQQVLDEGLDGWRKVLDKLVVRYRTGDFRTGATLVAAIADLADAADHHPDVDLRYPHVTVTVSSHDVGGITARDVRLARAITAAAASAGVQSTPHAPDSLELALDTADHERIRPFWAALLDYAEGDDDVKDRAARTPSVWFQDSDSTAPERQRWHLDVCVAHDVVAARIQAALDAGGTLVSDAEAPAFWVLADADGNQACLCTWQGRDPSDTDPLTP